MITQMNVCGLTNHIEDMCFIQPVLGGCINISTLLVCNIIHFYSAPYTKTYTIRLGYKVSPYTVQAKRINIVSREWMFLKTSG